MHKDPCLIPRTHVKTRHSQSHSTYRQRRQEDPWGSWDSHPPTTTHTHTTREHRSQWKTVSHKARYPKKQRLTSGLHMHTRVLIHVHHFYSQVWWPRSAIRVLRRQRKEDPSKFGVIYWHWSQHMGVTCSCSLVTFSEKRVARNDAEKQPRSLPRGRREGLMTESVDCSSREFSSKFYPQHPCWGLTASWTPSSRRI